MKHGFVIVHKEAGMTSHDCVSQLRRIYQQKRVGHAGTLDPNVTGVLPVALGQATKLIELLMASGKVYEGDITLGFSTTTEDAFGEVVQRVKVSAKEVKEEAIDQALASLEGTIVQIPPMYSAVKVKGKRLYEYARQGLEVERPRRKVHIDSFSRLSDLHYNAEEGTVRFAFRVACSKGTYVRTLATQVGELLGLPAHLSRLIRLKSGGFSLKDAHTLDQIGNQADEVVLPLEKYIADNFNRLTVPQALEKLAMNGGVLPNFAQLRTDQPHAVYIKDRLVGLYRLSKNGEDLRAFKMFYWQD